MNANKFPIIVTFLGLQPPEALGNITRAHFMTIIIVGTAIHDTQITSDF